MNSTTSATRHPRSLTDASTSAPAARFILLVSRSTDLQDFSCHKSERPWCLSHVRHFGLSVLCLIGLFAIPIKAQDPAITALSVMGVVSDVKADTHQVIVTTAAGSQVAVTLSDRTVFMRIPPGEKTKDKFIKIAPTDFTLGDSVFARGRMTEDRKSMPALEFYVMSKGDIAEKREREKEDWRKRGLAGTVNSINADTKEITIDARTAEGPKPTAIATTAETKFRRYAPDSVRFSDGKPSAITELKTGDQLR